VTLKTYFTPESLEEALDLKAEYGAGLMVMGGGTIVMHLINDGHLFPEIAMGLRRAGMDKVQVNGTAVIGATATLSQMTALAAYPMLQASAQAIAGWAVRNMGTIGGNLFARAPYGDFGVALLALNAQVKIQSSSKERTVPLEAFYTGGRQLAADELITEIHAPKPTGITQFHKFSRRQANAPTIVAAAAHVVLEDGRVTRARVALGGAGQTPVRSQAAEAALINAPITEESIQEAASAGAEASNPITDAVASEWYRRQMIAVQLRRTLTSMMDAQTEAS
jgi:CO/xanthine dehydrogenase FAD-binding subunit